MRGAGVPDRLLLLYREGCGKCRTLSALAVLLTLGGIERVPLSSAPDASLLCGEAARGRLLLFEGTRRITGRQVLPAVLRRWARAAGGGHGRR